MVYWKTPVCSLNAVTPGGTIIKANNSSFYSSHEALKLDRENEWLFFMSVIISDNQRFVLFSQLLSSGKKLLL